MMSDTEKSNQLYNEACTIIPGGVSRNTIYRKPYPHYVRNAKGCYITDIEGTIRLDFANNMASLIHGHAFAPVIESVIEQIKKGTAYTMGAEIEVEFAKLLTARAESFEKIRFMNSGTEAVMAMIKASRAFTDRPKIAKAEGAYHGTYDFAEISQTANPSNWGDINNPNSVPLVHGTPNDVLKNVVIFPYNDIDRTISILDKNAGDIACVLIDPVPHRVGLIPASAEFINAVYNWTRKNNALLVFDEVVSFRANFGGAQQNYKVKPDLTALGKMIGGGFPVGALAGRSDIMQVFDLQEKKLLFPHSGTFSANPVTMTAGYTTMKLFNEHAVEKINTRTKIAIQQISEMIRLIDVPVSITGAGSMFRLHLKSFPPSTYRETYQNEAVKAVINELLDYMYNKEHILMINTFSCMLSTVMKQYEIDRLTQGLSNAFKALKPKIMELQTIKH